MDQTSITLEELSALMPLEMRPVEALRERLIDDETLGWSRISALSRFATSYDDLVELVDNVSEETRTAFRDRFKNFVATLARKESCYEHRRRFNRTGIASRIDPGANVAALATALSEDDDADILIPSQGIALVGHDDFGCNLLYVEGNEVGRDWLITVANVAGLFSVKPPIDREQSAL